MKRGHLVILLVEDEEHDVFFVQQATAKGGAGHTVCAVHDGSDAIRYLRGEGQYADREKFPLPNVVLTDLKMPGMDGFELLRWVREHPECQIIPVIVHSSSAMESDIRKAYRLGANAYMVKPASITDLVELLRVTYAFWSVCECPSMPGG